MKVVILMAGIGSRLGSKLPKCLTPLKTDYTILDHQQADKIIFVSKTVARPVGEAVGINLIRAHDLPLVMLGLRQCSRWTISNAAWRSPSARG